MHISFFDIYVYMYVYVWPCLDYKTSLMLLKYICSNSQKYIEWVKIIDFSFMPKIIRTFKDILYISYRKYIKTSFLFSSLHC